MNIKYFHFRPRNGLNQVLPGGFTVAYRFNDAYGHYEYAMSRCSPEDNFCRKIGRVKAEGRLRSPRYLKHAPATSRDEFYDYLANELGIN